MKLKYQNKKKVIFSAMQPSGNLTIGNYIGALRQWIKLQKYYECIYCIADQHAIINNQNPNKIKENTLDTLALYLSCGINHKKSIIFIQSHVPQHSQLHWILNCYSYYGELKRMIQFKTNQFKKKINNAILNYPILMASDILLYQTNQVPIGKDQKQHLELTKKIAKRFNNIYGNIFTIPKYSIDEKNGKIMSLQDSKKKMSKSDINKNNIITLLEKPEIAAKKIKNAITDSEYPPKIYYNLEKKPSISNLLSIFSGITNKKISKIENQFKGKLYSEFKKKISEKMIIFLKKIQKKFKKIRNNKKLLDKILKNGANKATIKAKKTIKKVYQSIGFIK